MTLYWHRLHGVEAPDGDRWLGPEELEVLRGLRLHKRRFEWRLGRYVAKQAVASVSGIEPMARIQIIAADDGAPEVFIDGQRSELGISISHRNETAVCAVGAHGVGCDLEAIEPRTSRFVRDFFTEREVEAVERGPASERDLRVALTWSAKESALKVLRTGLRRDTRTVAVELGSVGRSEAGWQPFEAHTGGEPPVLSGWWRAEGGQVLTMIGVGEDEAPRPVVLEP